ncbi:unnamed protein product, partial [marine sediment metagenome]
MSHSRRRNKKLLRAVQIIIKDCLGIEPNDKVVIVTDEYCYTIGYSLWNSVKEITDPVLIEIEAR